MSDSGPPPGPQDWQPQGQQGQPGHPDEPSQYDPSGYYGQPSQYDPTGQYGQYGQYGAAPHGQPSPYGRPATSGKATASLILGIVSLCAGFLFGIPAVILGVLARRDIKRSEGRLSGDGLAIGGIVTGIIGTLLSLVFVGLLIAGLAISSSVSDACDQLGSSTSPNSDCA